MATTVELRFTPEPADAVAVQRAVFKGSLRRRRFWVRVVLLTLLGFATVCGLVALIGGPSAEAIGAALGGVAVGSAWLALIIGGNWLLLPRRARRWYAQQKTLHHEQRQTWDADGFRVDTDRGSSSYPWHEFHGWRIDRRIVALHASELMVYFAPRRALTDDQVAAIERLLADSGLPRL